jgi:hypothetical protein
LTKNLKKFTAKKKSNFCFIKTYNLPIPRPLLRMSKLQKKPSALKREHPALQNMKFLHFFLLLWVIFALLDPDSEYGSGSTDLIQLRIQSGYGSETLVSEHTVQLSLLRLEFLFIASYPHFHFYKMLFMMGLEFSCFVDFCVCIFKTKIEYGT